jgi:hypothetical protein
MRFAHASSSAKPLSTVVFCSGAQPAPAAGGLLRLGLGVVLNRSLLRPDEPTSPIANNSVRKVPTTDMGGSGHTTDFA